MNWLPQKLPASGVPKLRLLLAYLYPNCYTRSMKKLFLATALACTLAACQSNPSETAEGEGTSLQAELPTTYGQAIAAEGALAAAEVPALLQGKDSVYVSLKGNALGSCAKKGCWMNVGLAEGENMRVTFKDYGFFVPKDLSGQEVVMEGMLRRKVSSVEEQRHFAEDAGKSAEEIAAIQQADTIYSFEAVGVLIWPNQQEE